MTMADIGAFCNYMTADGLLCGMWVKGGKEGDRCARHALKQQLGIREKGVKFSGDSKYREENGQFQAKSGR